MRVTVPRSLLIVLALLMAASLLTAQPVSASAPIPADPAFAVPNNVAQTTFDLALGISDSPDPVSPGGQITYIMTVTWSGVSPATGVALTGTVPTNTTFVSLSAPAGWTCTTPAGGETGAYNCQIAVLDSSPSEFTLVVTVGAAVPSGSFINHFASVSADEGDTDATNDDASAETTVQVQTQADLGITKTGPAQVEPGNDIAYTITVTNSGPDAAIDAEWSDSLPGNVTFISLSAVAGWACTKPNVGSTGFVYCSRASFPTSASPAVFTLIVHVPESVVGGTIIYNSAETTSSTDDPNVSNNAALDIETQVGTTADLSVTKTVPPDLVPAGGNATYTITVINSGPDAATDAEWTDALPANLTFVSLSSVAGWNCTTPAVGATGPVFCSKPSFAVADSPAEFTLVAKVQPTVPGGTVIQNPVDVITASADPNTENNSDTASITVDSAADVGITKSGTPDIVPSGNNITYTITVTNAGPDAASDAEWSDGLPSQLTFVSLAGPAGWNCTTPAVGAGGTVYCYKSSFTVAQSPAVFTVVAKVKDTVLGGTNIYNSAEVATTATDTNQTNNLSADVQTTVDDTSDVLITKTDAPDPVLAGGNITYTITVDNLGPDAAADVDWTDELPDDVTFVSLSTPAGWNCTKPAVGATGDIYCAKVALLSVATPSVFTLVVKADQFATGGTVISNTAVATTSTYDKSSANNSATAETTITSVADLGITKEDSPDPVQPGGNITYTITVTNDGPDSAPNASWTDTLPSNVTFVSLSNVAGWTCTTPAVDATGTVTCNNTSFLTTASPAVFTLVVKVNNSVTSGTQISNTATVSSSAQDGVTTNNNATAQTTVSSVADVGITKTDAPDPVQPGANITYTVTVTNAGPDTALNASWTDTLPTNVTFVSLSSVAGWTCTTPGVGATGTVTCNNANFLTSASPAVFTLIVKVNSTVANGTQITNSATVSTTAQDTNTDNDSTGNIVTTVAAPAFTGSPNNLEIMNGLIGRPITRTISVTNTGAAGTTLNVTLTSISNPAFTITGLPMSQLQGAAAKNITIACTPQAGAPVTGTLIIATNDPIRLSRSYNLTCSPSKDTIGIFRPSNGTLYARYSNTTGFGQLTLSSFTNPGDMVILGDWNGDGIDTVGVFRNGQFLLRDSNASGSPVAYTFNLGMAGDIPVAGDWDGNGSDSVGVFRPAQGRFFLRNALSTGPVDYSIMLGTSTDKPVVGDWNGDGKDTPGIYRTSQGRFFLSNTTCANCVAAVSAQFTFGNPGDVGFSGDWNNDGTDGVGVFRPTNGITYFRNALSTGFADLAIVYGIANDTPLAGNWVGAPATPEQAPIFDPKRR